MKRVGFQNQSGIKPGRVCKNNSNNNKNDKNDKNDNDNDTLTMFERLALPPAFLAVGCLAGLAEIQISMTFAVQLGMQVAVSSRSQRVITCSGFRAQKHI